MKQIRALYELRGLGAMSWSDADRGWAAAPEDIVGALVSEGFVASERGATAIRGDVRSAGGTWRGIHPRTGSVASATWLDRPTSSTRSIVFITIDAESVVGRAIPGADAA